MSGRYPTKAIAEQGSRLALFLAIFALSAHAQLNENCVVSILNRSAQVQPDGSWKIDNVPAGFGPVKARATCVNDGVTQFSQSDLFQISANQVDRFNCFIVPGSSTTHPTSNAITAHTTTLSSADQ